MHANDWCVATCFVISSSFRGLFGSCATQWAEWVGDTPDFYWVRGRGTPHSEKTRLTEQVPGYPCVLGKTVQLSASVFVCVCVSLQCEQPARLCYWCRVYRQDLWELGQRPLMCLFIDLSSSLVVCSLTLSQVEIDDPHPCHRFRPICRQEWTVAHSERPKKTLLQ